MKIFRLCLVKEEDNILEGAVVTAAPWADGIFLADNGSSDETPMAIERLTRSYPRVINIGPLAEPFIQNRSQTQSRTHRRQSLWKIINCSGNDR